VQNIRRIQATIVPAGEGAIWLSSRNFMAR
jgi:hypothetical protein